jgi:hypothetical protein
MPILFLAIWPLLAIPLVNAFLARTMGRPFWTWFALGCVLPIISFFILFFLPEVKGEKRAKDPAFLRH